MYRLGWERVKRKLEWDFIWAEFLSLVCLSWIGEGHLPRIAASRISRARARAACLANNVPALDMEACIFDVRFTGEIAVCTISLCNWKIRSVTQIWRHTQLRQNHNGVSSFVINIERSVISVWIVCFFNNLQFNKHWQRWLFCGTNLLGSCWCHRQQQPCCQKQQQPTHPPAIPGKLVWNCLTPCLYSYLEIRILEISDSKYINQLQPV